LNLSTRLREIRSNFVTVADAMNSATNRFAAVQR